MDKKRRRRIPLLPGLLFAGLLFSLQWGWIAAGLTLAGRAPNWIGGTALLLLLVAFWRGVWKNRRHYLRYHRGMYLYFSIFFGVTIAGGFLLLWTMPAGLLRGAHQLSAEAFWGWVAIGWALSWWVVLHGFGEGLFRLRKPVIEIPIHTMTDATKPLRIAHVTDLHIGPHLHGQRLERYVQEINALEPHAIVITGDIIDINPYYIAESFGALARLSAPLGVFAVLGNHDFYAGDHRVEKGLAEFTDIVLLRNRWVKLRDGSPPIFLIGIDDPVVDWMRPLEGEKFKHLDKAMEDLPEYGTRILLSHRPDAAPYASTKGIDLVLAGHTHGGQFEAPWPGSHRFNLGRIVTPYPRGHYAVGPNTHLYTNPGLGLVVAPWRFFVPREIAQIALVSASVQPNVKIHPDRTHPDAEAEWA